MANAVGTSIPLPMADEIDIQNNEEVRALAEKLAPALEEADAILRDTATVFTKDSETLVKDDDDDDDLDEEVEALEQAEQLLRQELELAQDFSKLFGKFSPSKHPELTVTTPISGVREADMDQEEEKTTPEQDMPGLEPIPLTPATPTTPSSPLTQRTSDVLFAASSSGFYYTQSEHFQNLFIKAEEQGGWYTVNLTSFVCQQTNELPVVEGLEEYCLALPDTKLKHLFVGLPEILSTKTTSVATTTTTTATTNKEPMLPVRTLTVRIRPDVLCGAVMDAVHHALEQVGANVEKRQGGHLQAEIGGAVFVQPSTWASDEDDGGMNTPQEVVYPPYFVDVQLCAHKSQDCDCRRLLLIRIYHCEDLNDVLVSRSVNLEDAIDTRATKHLREACALIQRIESPKKAKRIRPKTGTPVTSQQVMRQIVSNYLLENYHACPSVKEGAITLPSLNSDDWPVILSSWRFIQLVWDELETRDLAYTTLLSSRFGAFPALPTLDVHYCSQMRRLSREIMIVQLLKSASELEDYAREAEYACANMIALLQPTFETYAVEAPALPKATPLTAYPLDFTAPQQVCPPWGQLVMEALNEIQAKSSDANLLGDDSMERMAAHLGPLAPQVAKESLEMAEWAVMLVFQAFQAQDDEEKGARLGRKNVQVMDRLAKMQEHQRVSINKLRDAHLQSEKASRAADDFLMKTGIREVPLIKWSIVAGSSTGTCLVTANHVLFVTQLIPVIGGSTTNVFPITSVEFSVQEGPASLLNPLPTIISVTQNGNEVYSFRPSMGGARLKSFLDVVRSISLSENYDK